MNSEQQRYFGKDCPVGMVQVEFVGCDPAEKYSEYGWKPVPAAFLEVYVDGKRFRINVGNIGDNGRRGLGIVTDGAVEIERTESNGCALFIVP